MIIRTVDNLGRIVIPNEIARYFDIKATIDSVEIFYEDQKEYIILKKYYGTCCVFCGSGKTLTWFKNKYICTSCLKNAKVYDPSNTVMNTCDIMRLKTRKKRAPSIKASDMIPKLVELKKQNPSLTQRELAKYLNTSQPRVSLLLNRLRKESKNGENIDETDNTENF